METPQGKGRVRALQKVWFCKAIGMVSRNGLYATARKRARKA